MLGTPNSTFATSFLNFRAMANVSAEYLSNRRTVVEYPFSASMPLAVKKEVMAMIKVYLEKQFEP